MHLTLAGFLQGTFDGAATDATTYENAGSDARGIQTTAVKRGDRYVITGEKMWISMADVAATFDADLARRGLDLRFDLLRLDDPGFRTALAEVYPESHPVDALASVFDVYA